MSKGEPVPYVICGTYSKEDLKIIKNKLIKSGYDTSDNFISKDGRPTFYYSKDLKFT